MPHRRNLPLLPLIFLIFACNLPQTIPAETGSSPPAATASHAQRPKVIVPSASPSVRMPPDPTGTATIAPPLLPGPETADEFFARCPPREEIDALLAEIPIVLEADPTAGTAACKAGQGSVDLSPLQKRVYLSVLIMKYITFDAPLPWTEKTLYAWFLGAIKAIRIRADIANSFCCEPLDTINILVAENSYLLLTGRWIEPSMGGGLMDTLALYVHEARHNEGYYHTCNAGRDDKTVAEMGAWGVQYYLLEWLALHSDPAFFRAPGGDPDLYRRIALEHSLLIRSTRFCDEPALTPGPTPTL